MATINGADKIMGSSSSPMRASSASSGSTHERDVFALLIVVIAITTLSLIASGYLIWRSTTPFGGVQTPGPQNAAAVPSAPQPSEATATPTAPQVRAFFGKVVSVDGNKLTIQEVVQPAAAGQKGTDGKVRELTLTDSTVLKYQKPNGKNESGAPQWTEVEGKKTDLKKDTLGLFTVNEDIATTDKLTASRVDYSDKFPFDY